MNDIHGEIVSEEETAVGLGFANVAEMRRWETEMGQDMAALQASLGAAERDRDHYRWHGRRMQVVLERIHASPHWLEPLDADTRLAIGVVLGKAVDWGNTLKDWFDKP